jgi:hypothetical protein
MTCRHPPCFTSILSTFWSIVNTVTTCGYGDVVPYTAFGKLLATIASLVGIVVLALPIAVFENNFARLHESRDVCTAVIMDLSMNNTCIIDEEAISRWIEAEIGLDRCTVSLNACATPLRALSRVPTCLGCPRARAFQVA